MGRAYYNEIDPFAAAWLRNLIAAGHIAPGDVDERSIVDIRPADLKGYTQCHFFAGIGVWSYALRLAGWPDRAPVWTGSCPCQPFSAAGKGKGFDDERHLWPAFHYLIEQCQPRVVFGEQVASKDGLAWLDLVSTDLEGANYSCGAVDLCAAGIGAPHIRQRLWWVAERLEHAGGDGPQGRLPGRADAQRSALDRSPRRDGPARGLADNDSWGLGKLAELYTGWSADSRERRDDPDGWGAARGMADASGERRQQVAGGSPGDEEAHGRAGRDRSQPDSDNLVAGAGEVCGAGHPSPTNGHWRDADWLFCRDGKWRPVESGTFPLAHGATARVGRLRAYGNAIVAQAAQAFIESYLDTKAVALEVAA